MVHFKLFKGLMLSLLLTLSANLFAHDFEKDGIYYNINSGSSNVEVTYKGDSYNSRAYSGDVALQESVEYNGIVYSVTSIGASAFSECYDLTGITIPNSVTSIGEGAFSECHGLTGTLTIPNSVTSIGDFAFDGCHGLTEITIPNTVTSIGEGAFSCNLTSITVESGNTTYDSRENCNAIIETASNELIAGCKNTIIPNSVTSIGGYAFYGCTDLIGTLTIPNSVISIGDYAFGYCWNLTEITIPNSVTSIGNYAFCECSPTEITIPNTVTSIGEGAFLLDYSSFTSSSSLTSITVENGNTTYDSRENCNAIIETASNELIAGCKNTIIPNSVTSIGDYAFFRCGDFTEITLPNSVTSIGDYAFYGCFGLTEITLPNSVTTIGDYAFSYCSGLTEITFPNSVTSIGDYAFYACSGLTEISCLAEKAPTLGSYFTFPDDTPNTPIYVPIGSLGEYKSAEDWGNRNLNVRKAIPATEYASFSTTCPVKVPEGITAYKAKMNDSKTAVVLTEIAGDVIPPYTGVIISGATENYVFVPTYEDFTMDDFMDNELIASVVQPTVPEYGTYAALKANELAFAKLQNGLKLSAGKAYLPVSETVATRPLGVVFADGEVTGMEAVVECEDEKNGTIYNLQGICVTKPVKGMYIKNGKKYIKQ